MSLARYTIFLLISLIFSNTKAEESAVIKQDPITVIASGHAQSSHKSAGGVAVISSDDIDDLNVQSLGDILTTTPGVDAIGGPRSALEQPNVRGLGNDRVVLRFDDARQNFQHQHKGQMFIDPDLLAQVDIYRGPNSTLHGSGALGGVLAFRTKDASDFLQEGDTWGGRIKNGYQSNNHHMFSSLSLYGQGRTSNGLVNAVFRRNGDFRAGNDEKMRYTSDAIQSGLAKFNWQANDAHKLTFTGLFFHDNYRTPIAGARVPDGIVKQPKSFQDTKQHTASLSHHYNPDSDAIDLKTTFYHAGVVIHDHVEKENDSRKDRTQLNTLGLKSQNTTCHTLSPSITAKVTYGFESYRDTQVGHRNGRLRKQYPRSSAWNTGLYLQNDLSWRQFTLSPGIRYDFYNLHSKNKDLKDRHLGSTSPRASLTWAPADWMFLYGQYAEAFRAPELTALYGRGNHFGHGSFANEFISNPNLKSEKAFNKEIGLGFDVKDILTDKDQFRAKFSGFVNHVHNLIETQIMDDKTTRRNAKRARIKGIEADISYSTPCAFFSLGGSILQGDELKKHRPLHDIPAHKLFTTAGYRFVQSNITVGWRALFAADQTRVPGGESLEPKTPGYGIHNVFLSWEPVSSNFAQTRLDLGIDNLFNRRYRKHLSQLPEIGRVFKIALTLAF